MIKELSGLGVRIKYDEKLNEWEVTLFDGYRSWFDGDLTNKEVVRAAVNLDKWHKDQIELYPRRGYAHFT